MNRAWAEHLARYVLSLEYLTLTGRQRIAARLRACADEERVEVPAQSHDPQTKE